MTASSQAGWTHKSWSSKATSNENGPVDKMLSHQGTQMDMDFELLWKSGDRTWLPYSQVEHLDTLRDYFNLISIATIGELVDGNGEVPTDQPQVFLGHLCLTSYPTNTPPFSPPISASLHPNERALTTMHNPTLHNFVPNGPGLYSFSDMHCSPTPILHNPRAAQARTTPLTPVPLGYDEFAYIFNFNEPNMLMKFTTS
ncbi:hypothetical protein EDD22DRAFT_960617 [Suillus occidentalis]|nr:hypothetical protein EDD22DRAFT_960617 [Suillus occidentalis]